MSTNDVEAERESIEILWNLVTKKLPSELVNCACLIGEGRVKEENGEHRKQVVEESLIKADSKVAAKGRRG
jgi:hypothetical protein